MKLRKTDKQSTKSANRRQEKTFIDEQMSQSIEEMADSQQNSILRKMPATSSTTVDSISSSYGKRNTTKSSGGCADESLHIYSRVSSTHPDPDSTFDSYKNGEKKVICRVGRVAR